MNEMMLYRRLRNDGLSHSEADEIVETWADQEFDRRRDDDLLDSFEQRECTR
jgi:hypothetical protein